MRMLQSHLRMHYAAGQRRCMHVKAFNLHQAAQSV